MMAKACAHAENRSRILARHWKPQASTEEKLQLVLDSVDNRDFRMNSKDVQNLRELLSRMDFKRDQQDTASVKKRVRVALEWQVHCRSPLGFQSAIIAPAHNHALTARARQLGSIGRLNTRGGGGGGGCHIGGAHACATCTAHGASTATRRTAAMNQHGVIRRAWLGVTTPHLAHDRHTK